MKNFSRITLVFVLFFCIATIAIGEDLTSVTAPLDLSAKDWEQHPDAGISIAMKLVAQTGKNQLLIYIKNTSKRTKDYSCFHSLSVYYQDAKGKETTLIEPAPGTFDASRIITSSKPGEIVMDTNNLSLDDFIAAKTYPIKCEFNLAEKNPNNDFWIKSEFRKLVSPTEP